MQKLLRLGAIALVAPLLLLASGCASSLVYSPAVKLPAHPLAKDDGELIAGVAALPETRPQIAGAGARPGYDITARYAFSDQLTLGIDAYGDLHNIADGSFRGGYGVEAVVPIGAAGSGGYRLGLMPRGAALFDGMTIEGWGVTLPVVVWFPSSGIFTNFAAAGPAIGFRHLSSSDDISDSEPFRAEWGYGLIGNLGTSIAIAEHFRANVELAGVIAVNQFDGITHGIFAPTVGMAWKF